MALCGELAFVEAMDTSQDRLQHEWLHIRLFSSVSSRNRGRQTGKTALRTAILYPTPMTLSSPLLNADLYPPFYTVPRPE